MVYLGDCPPLHLRELVPRDFYYAQVLRSSDRSSINLIERLVLNPEALDLLPARFFSAFIKWSLDNLIEDKVLTVENWLEVAFHLCKQRWDQSVDWLEQQPASKIFAMIEILKKHAEDQEKQAKKASRGKK